MSCKYQNFCRIFTWSIRLAWRESGVHICLGLWSYLKHRFYSVASGLGAGEGCRRITVHRLAALVRNIDHGAVCREVEEVWAPVLTTHIAESGIVADTTFVAAIIPDLVLLVHLALVDTYTRLGTGRLGGRWSTGTTIAGQNSDLCLELTQRLLTTLAWPFY